MKAKWILLAATAALAVGCHTPKVETYKYKAPVFTPPTFPELDRLLENLKNMKCESTDGKIGLSGAISQTIERNRQLDTRLSTDGEVSVTFAEPKPVEFKPEEGVKRELLNAGCSEEMVKAHSEEGMVVRQYEKEATTTVAAKVLLCGKLEERNTGLLLVSETIVMKDFSYATTKQAMLMISTGKLILEGENKLVKYDMSTAKDRLEAVEGVSLMVATGIEGKGSLKITSKFFTCSSQSTEGKTAESGEKKPTE